MPTPTPFPLHHMVLPPCARSWAPRPPPSSFSSSFHRRPPARCLHACTVCAFHPPARNAEVRVVQLVRATTTSPPTPPRGPRHPPTPPPRPCPPTCRRALLCKSTSSHGCSCIPRPAYPTIFQSTSAHYTARLACPLPFSTPHAFSSPLPLHRIRCSRPRPHRTRERPVVENLDSGDFTYPTPRMASSLTRHGRRPRHCPRSTEGRQRACARISHPPPPLHRSNALEERVRRVPQTYKATATLVLSTSHSGPARVYLPPTSHLPPPAPPPPPTDAP